MSRRGNVIHEAYAARIEAERLLQPAVGGCLWCPDFRPEGTLADTRAAALEHRLTHHPQAKPSKRLSRSRPHQTFITSKSLAENVQAARAQGASGAVD